MKQFPQFSSLSIQDHDGIILLTLHKPQDKNALSVAVLGELAAATRFLANSQHAAGVVITGAGKYFSVGGDLREYQRVIHDQPDGIRDYANQLTEPLSITIRNIQRIDSPVIAAVNGQVAGAGFSLALACDYRIAASRASFNFAYGRIGSAPDGGMTWFLPRVVGYSRAVQLLLEQPVLRAQGALAEGIIQDIVPESELVPTCIKRLQEIHNIAPYSQRSAKRLVQRSLHTSLDEHLEMENAMFANSGTTQDMRRGIDALLAGDWPHFSGTESDFP
jgi:enoyl-CoA hydratase/carnithine racemase